MPISVEFLFNPDHASEIIDVWQDLYDANVDTFLLSSGSKPHITLAIFNDIPPEVLEKSVKNLAEKIHKFELTLSILGVFPGEKNTIFLAPSFHQFLYSIHQAFHSLTRTITNQGWENYLPYNWIPHCTLGVDVPREKVGVAMEICSHLNLPVTVDVEKIGVVEFSPTKNYQFIELQEPETSKRSETEE